MAEQKENTQVTNPPIFEIYQYSYQSKKPPGKPPILDALQGLQTAAPSGTDMTFAAVAE